MLMLMVINISMPNRLLNVRNSHRAPTGNRYNDGSTIYYYLGKVTKSQGINFARPVFNTIVNITNNQQQFYEMHYSNDSCTKSH